MGAWKIEKLDGKEIVEGHPLWFHDIEQNDIKSFTVMGLIMPTAIEYKFGREAIATPGGRGTPVKLNVSCVIDQFHTIDFEFILANKIR